MGRWIQELQSRVFMYVCSMYGIYVYIFLFLCKNQLKDLKLVIEDTIDNVATLQDCSMDQGESMQLIGEQKYWLSLALPDTNTCI